MFRNNIFRERDREIARVVEVFEQFLANADRRLAKIMRLVGKYKIDYRDVYV